MGQNHNGLSGNGDEKDYLKIIKIYFFGNKNIKIKKINIGGSDEGGFSLFLTSNLIIYKKKIIN
jgi:hypothetical protein